MSINWDDWVHVTISTRGSWLPGDPRGFRNHDHRIHSTRFYKTVEPLDEHQALHRYARSITAGSVVIPIAFRSVIAESLADKLADEQVAVRIIAVASQHAHLLVRVGQQNAKPVVGRAKQAASFQVRDVLPGTIWAAGCHPVRVRDYAHFRNIVEYIERHVDDGAAIWIHPDLRQASGPASNQRNQ